MVDLRRYLGNFFIKLSDVQDGPIEKTIVAVEDGSYDKANLVFDDGARLPLNATNFRALFAAFGIPLGITFAHIDIRLGGPR